MPDTYVWNGYCPDCSHEDFAEGSSGGGSMNIQCTSCGSKFNISLSGNLERIGESKFYGELEKKVEKLKNRKYKVISDV